MAVENLTDLTSFRKLPDVADTLAGLDDEDVLAAIKRRKGGGGCRSFRQGSGDRGDARRARGVRRTMCRSTPTFMPGNSGAAQGPSTSSSRRSCRSTVCARCWRSRGSPAWKAPCLTSTGEYRDDVERADLSLDPQWFPAVENRGEGVLIHFSASAIREWLARPGVSRRIRDLEIGHTEWANNRTAAPPLSRRDLCDAAHAVAPAAAIHSGPVRLSGRLDPRACVRGRRISSLRSSPVHIEPRCRGDTRRVGCNRLARSKATSNGRFAPRRCAPTIRSALSTLQRRASKDAGFTGRRVTAAPLWRRHRARCATTTWTVPWWCRPSTWTTQRSSPIRVGCDGSSRVDCRPSLRKRLVRGLDTGALAAPYSASALQMTLGQPDAAALADLERLAEKGIRDRGAAEWIRALDQAARPAMLPDLVWSGPEVPGGAGS